MQRAAERNGCALTSTSCLAHCLSKRYEKDCMYCAAKVREIETRKGGRKVVDWRKPVKQAEKVGFFPS